MTFEGLTDWKVHDTVEAAYRFGRRIFLYKTGLILALRIASQLAYMVLIPLFIFGGLGLLADRQFGSLPKLLLVGIGIAFAATIYWINRRFREVAKVKD